MHFYLPLSFSPTSSDSNRIHNTKPAGFPAGFFCLKFVGPATLMGGYEIRLYMG